MLAQKTAFSILELASLEGGPSMTFKGKRFTRPRRPAKNRIRCRSKFSV